LAGAPEEGSIDRDPDVFTSLEKPMPNRIARYLLCLLPVALLCGAAPALAASPLALDPGFGSDGVVRAGTGVAGFGEAAGVVLTPNGDILVAGVEGEATTLARYLANGQLDPGYGKGGVKALPMVAAGRGQSLETIGGINGLAATGDGGALLLWQGSKLTRVDSSGNAETSFGSGGTVDLADLDSRFTSLHFNAVSSLPDGGSVVAGIRYGSPQMVVARLLPNGALDESFGERGLATVEFGGGSNSGARRMAVGAGGVIVLAGYAHGNPAVVRLLPDGAPDPTFGNRGRAVAPRWLHGQATALTLTSGGGAIVSGSCWRKHGPSDLRPLLRFGPNGNWDHGFSRATLSHPLPAVSWPRFILANGRRIVLVGNGKGPLARSFTADGKPDPAPSQASGVPRDRVFGVFAAAQGSKLLLAWTPAPNSGDPGIHLARFSVR
jgi:uncharacterized delta-60 repeat protein